MNLQTLFAVPLAIDRISGTEELNLKLTQLFLEKEKDPSAMNMQRNSVRLAAVFESRFDLFNWPNPEVVQLRELCLRRIYQFAVQINRMSSDQAKRLQIHADAWFHITRNGGYFTAHNHPNASWSAVYCVASGDDTDAHPENGVLRFLDFKSHAAMYLDPANSNLPEPFGIGNRVFKLSAADLVIFPSYLLHEVAPYFGQSERITVAMNCWFKDPKLAYPG